MRPSLNSRCMIGRADRLEIRLLRTIMNSIPPPLPHHAQKIVNKRKELDNTNEDVTERAKALKHVIDNTKKKERRDIVLEELRIRLAQKNLYNSDHIPKPAKATLEKMALVLHWTERKERGEKTPVSKKVLNNPTSKIIKKKGEAYEKECEKRGLPALTSTGKRGRSIMAAKVDQEFNSKIMEYVRQALVERGVNSKGNQQELVNRLARSVLGLNDDGRTGL